MDTAVVEAAVVEAAVDAAAVNAAAVDAAIEAAVVADTDSILDVATADTEVTVASNGEIVVV